MNGRYVVCGWCHRFELVTVCGRVAVHGCAGDLVRVTRDGDGCAVVDR